MLKELPERYQIYRTGSEELYPVDDGPLARALHGESVMVDDAELRFPDRIVSLTAWVTPIRGRDGAIHYALVAFQDNTPQKEAEATRARLEAQLHQAERLESIGRLAGGVAHDFNNLLTPMLVYTEMALQGLPEGSPVRKQIAQVHDSAEHAAALTKQLLAFGRRQLLEPRSLDLNQELRKFEKMIRRLVREDIELSFELDPGLGRVRADASEMQRIFMNLALNAADAMPEGGRLTLATENRELGLDTSPPSSDGSPPLQGAFVMLRVSDTGQGMDEQTLAKVFEPFYTTKPTGHGTGLGLPTAYGIVTQHGGRLSVRSRPGQGTTFEVLLPRLPEGAVTDTQLGEAKGRLRQGHGEIILVVEDESVVRAAVTDILTGRGYKVIAAEGPNQALELARELGNSIALLVTDIVMPAMNGRDLFAELKRSDPSLRALFISGYSNEEHASESANEGAPELLQKPFSAEALGQKVSELLTH